jgi:hypothetical protein
MIQLFGLSKWTINQIYPLRHKFTNGETGSSLGISGKEYLCFFSIRVFDMRKSVSQGK